MMTKTHDRAQFESGGLLSIFEELTCIKPCGCVRTDRLRLTPLKCPACRAKEEPCFLECR